jgi:hypothetical protein
MIPLQNQVSAEIALDSGEGRWGGDHSRPALSSVRQYNEQTTFSEEILIRIKTPESYSAIVDAVTQLCHDRVRESDLDEIRNL